MIGIFPIFAHFFSFLILKSSSRTCSCIQMSRIILCSLCCSASNDRSQISPFLQHSMLSRSESTLQISNCGSRSVPPNLVRHASLEQIRIHNARSLAGPLATCFAASAKSNQFAPCCVNLTQNQTPSSVLSNRCCVLIQRSQFNITRLFKFESLNPSVLPCRSLRLWI